MLTVRLFLFSCIHLATLKIHNVSQTPLNFEQMTSPEVAHNSRNEAKSLMRILFLLASDRMPVCQVLCTPYNHAPCHFMQSHIRKVYACLAVTCHLHFWQHDWDLLRATAVTQGWNRYRNKSQHRKLTLERKILPPLLQGFEPATFQSRVRCSNHWAIPAPLFRIILYNQRGISEETPRVVILNSSACCPNMLREG